MNIKRNCFFLILSFFLMTGIVCGETKGKIGDTVPVRSTVCDYYETHYDNEGFETMEIDDDCYIVFLTTEEIIVLCGENCIESIPQTTNTNGSGHSGLDSDEPVPNPTPTQKDLNYYSDDYINLKKIVYQINKGDLAAKYKEEYNLKYIKAATLTTDTDKFLVIQFLPNKTGATRTTVKISFNRDGSNDVVNISSTVDATDEISSVLGELPLWLLESAPGYDSTKYNNFETSSIKNAILTAFKDITDYRYIMNNNKYLVSARVPDNINSRVLTIYSGFLNDIPLTAQAVDPVASNEGESTKDINKVKNTKTGAFLSITIIVIGFIIALVGGFLVYRYSKIKKI